MSTQAIDVSATPSQAAIDLARQVGESMFAVDTATKDTMGMELVACQPGRAEFRMTVKELHLNGHKICHGGFIFTLLTCVGQEQTMSGRHGIYDMKVTNQKGEVIAMFRGKSAQIQGTVIPE